MKKIYSSEAYNNLDIYQINCTYYSALGNDDASYLLARAIQLFAPGIPQVYYVGLLAGENDIELLEATKEGRNINRHYYSKEEVASEVARPVVQELFELFKFRNRSTAFDGEFEVRQPTEHSLEITRTHGAVEAKLSADMSAKEFVIQETMEDEILYEYESPFSVTN